LSQSRKQPPKSTEKVLKKERVGNAGEGETGRWGERVMLLYSQGGLKVAVKFKIWYL